MKLLKFSSFCKIDQEKIKKKQIIFKMEKEQRAEKTNKKQVAKW